MFVYSKLDKFMNLVHFLYKIIHNSFYGIHKIFNFIRLTIMNRVTWLVVSRHVQNALSF
ncbi:hypothetical protein DESC_660010 [Desulfosarcina cetonica]|nr:hypothetical protein DESC_660010 [Desulfosarcina cetonica]